MSARLTWQPGGDSWKGSFGRRKFLAGAAALGAGLATAGCAGTYDVASGITGSSGGDNRSTLVYWNLFTGGDGTHMQAMEAAYTKAHPEVDLQSTILQWGSPYYTKLSLAIRSGSPPDVASPAAGADRAAVPRVPGSAPDQHLLGADPASGPGPDRGVHLQEVLRRRADLAGAGGRGGRASWWVSYRRIALPLARPAIAAVSIFTFVWTWNNFLWPFLAATSQTMMTIPAGPGTVVDGVGIINALQVASAVLGALPLVFVFLLAQRQIVEGVAGTGLK